MGKERAAHHDDVLGNFCDLHFDFGGWKMKWEILEDKGDFIRFYVRLAKKSNLQKVREKVLKEFLEKNERGDFTARFVFNFELPEPKIDYIPASRWFAD